jgi:3-deoxy-D-glycero-D-galacto-nononate cytidylyltransferase
LSYSLNDKTPVIKTSLGFFAEIVSLDALIKTAGLTEEKQYREHVTNFIYAHPNLFNVKLIPLPYFFEDKKYARLTVDTKNDFDNAKKIYAQLKHQNKEINPENCCEIINEDSEMKDSMIAEIEKNKK